MSRASTALSRTVSPSLPHSLARTPADLALLDEARQTLVNTAPTAAIILGEAVSGKGDKEQITAARDVLDRVGLSASASAGGSAPSGDTVMSEVAFGAFRALLSHFGLEVPSTPRPVEPAIPAVSEVLEPAPKKTKTKRKKTKEKEDDFLVALEDEDE